MSFYEHGNSPTNYMTDDPLFRLEWKKNLINTIFLKDIIERHSIKDAFLLEEVFLFCVNNISNNTNLTNILNALKSHGIITNLTTLGSYLSYLRDAYLLYEVGLYDVQGKKVLNRERKYYLGDPTYRRVLFSGYDAGAGKILENLIYLEAHSR